MKPFDFLIVVVIYECDLAESLTFQSLLKIQSFTPGFPDILLYDNSSVSRYNEKYSKNFCAFKHDPDNSGVAGAYNYALGIAKTLNKEWLILFDQDTSVNESYFSVLYNYINEFSSEVLFCPSIRSNGKIVSPARYFAKKAFCLNMPKTGLLKSKHYTIINSGLAIKCSVLDELGGYNEDLPLDYSDHYFFMRYKQLKKHFVTISCENLHHLSSNSDTSLATVYNRFKKYSASTYVYSKKIKSILPVVWLYLRTFKLTFKFLSLGFFKYLFLKK